MNCIFCNSSDSSRKFSKEHIIPSNIGGSIIINNVCVDCNSKFGSEVDITLTRNIHIYESYAKLSKSFNLNLEFSFKDAYFNGSDGIKIKAGKRSGKKKTLITKVDNNNFVTDKNDDSFYVQYLLDKGKKKNISSTEIKKVIEDYKKWNDFAQIGDEFYNELFEITIVFSEDRVSFHYIMEAETPHRYLAKACVEFANLFNISDQIKNIDILKTHAKYGNQMQNIKFFEEVHKEIVPCSFHYVLFTETQFIIGLFGQVNFAIDIVWKEKPCNLAFANDLITKKLIYCELNNKKLRFTDKEVTV